MMDPLAAVALVAHLGLRMAYFLYIGLSLRRQHVRPQTDPVRRRVAWLRFRSWTSFILVNDAVTFAALVVFTAWSLPTPVPLPVVVAVGVLLVVVGAGVKIWAWQTIGNRGYYCYNFFCGDEQRQYVAKGPYRYLRNPMYGVGYAHMFGWALIWHSAWGLAAALFDWIVVWTMYLWFERPHTRRHSTARTIFEERAVARARRIGAGPGRRRARLRWILRAVRVPLHR